MYLIYWKLASFLSSSTSIDSITACFLLLFFGQQCEPELVLLLGTELFPGQLFLSIQMEFDCKLFFFFTKVVKKHASTIWNKVEVAPLERDHPPWIKPFKNNYHCRTPVNAEGLLQRVGHWVQPFITHSSSGYVRQEWGKLMGVPFILTGKLLESHKQTYESVSVFVCDILEIHIIRWNVVLQLSVWVNMLYFCLSIVFNLWTNIYASYIHIYMHQIYITQCIRSFFGGSYCPCI